MDDYLDGPGDTDDVFPCKGCGEILEEGKAFELSGLRWHLDCFRCNTCNTLLDSDANLLLLGDGSLICNNCTYSCNACGNKIEDLAILTGDQAFCATCFRCRNCKRKIENLRYARTSQGIFCMSCHESLMARRRKKSKAAAQAKAREKDGSPMIRDKSLPALPPNAIPPNAFSNDKVAPDSDMPTELSPRPRAAYTLNDSSSRSSSRPSRSPDLNERIQESIKEPSNLAPPTHNYRNNRNSSIISGDVLGGDGESFFIPVALDPTPAPSVNSRSASGTPADPSRKVKDNKDYFSVPKTSETKSDSQASTPHIAFQEKFQEKGRTPSADYESPQPEQRPTRRLSKRQNGLPRASPVINDERKASGSNVCSPSEEFKLQEAPKSKKLISSRANSQGSIAHDSGGSPNKHTTASQRNKDLPVASTQSDSHPLLGAPDKDVLPRNSLDARGKDGRERPSLESSNSSNNVIPRKEVPPAPTRSDDGQTHASSVDANDSTAAPQHLQRPAPLEQKLSDTYMQPRAPPQVPMQQTTPKEQTVSHSKSASDPTTPKASPKLPRWSAGGDFSMDEDMARILGTDEGSSSILRRVSNAVRHGRNNSTESSNNHHMNMPRIGHSRSVSETTKMTSSPRWPTTPITEEYNGGRGHEISSPISLSGGVTQDDPAFLKRQLRNSEQRVAELERQFNTEKDLKNLNKKLIEKRKTVSVLDTQTEIMIRQLEVLAGYVERAKETNQPIDPRDLEDSAIKEFVQKLDKVKQTMSAAIEELLAERDDLMEERNQAIADRDRALLEFEQLSSKNAQLADLNNDLTHQIQERFKSQIGTELKSPNGLGIYSHHSKGASNASVNIDASSLHNAHTLVATDDEPVLEGPTVVNIRKGQVRKFNWKKGGSKVASGITKGINRAAGAFQGPDMPPQRHPGLAGENIGLPYNMTVSQVDSPVSQGPNGQNRVPSETAGKGFGFFGGSRPKPPRTMNAINMSGSIPTIAEAPTTLFGSDLVERADYERRQIPSVVTRCIEEVELRGMDVEGIYRKTGGNSQVKMVQEGFDKNEDFDISDPSIDITAVTSVLKQYFRKLPVPLLTFDVYERILESNAVENDRERCEHLRKTFNMLPPKHRDCLEFLMFHLARVASRERENLMSPKNLAVVFAPTIMRDQSIEKEMTDMHSKNIAVQYIIEHSDTIFSDA